MREQEVDGEMTTMTASTAITVQLAVTQMEGNILRAHDDIIMHQTNCTAKVAAGLAKDLFKRYPRANVYRNRKSNAKPGSIQIIEQEEGKPTVINCNAQVYPGKASYVGPDSSNARRAMFNKCLHEVQCYISSRTETTLSVAVPWRIGCGLAGGDWEDYHQIIIEWAENMKKNCDKDVTINIYRMVSKQKCQYKTRVPPTTILSGTIAEVCEHKPHPRRKKALRNQIRHGMKGNEVRRLARRAGLMRIPGITYDTNEELVSSDGHTNAALIGTHGGGDGEWTGIPSTPKQKRQKAYAIHTTVKQSKIPGAGLGLFTLEKAKPEERVAIYSGDMLTQEQADASDSKYIVQVGKYFLDGVNTMHTVGRYVNYAPYNKANARLRAGTKPTWDVEKKRWWVSIRAKKNIKPDEELTMPYGQAYKGLTQQSKKPAPAMMQQPAKQTRCESTVRCSNSSWQRACGRVMNRITHVSQQ